jgi:hypothetical protein
MLTIDAKIAKRIIALISEHGQSAPGFGDLIIKVETEARDARHGSVVERDGESSIDGVLLNDGRPSIRYDEMVWISFGHARSSPISSRSSKPRSAVSPPR